MLPPSASVWPCGALCATVGYMSKVLRTRAPDSTAEMVERIAVEHYGGNVSLAVRLLIEMGIGVFEAPVMVSALERPLTVARAAQIKQMVGGVVTVPTPEPQRAARREMSEAAQARFERMQKAKGL